jgi:competence protein ComGC
MLVSRGLPHKKVGFSLIEALIVFIVIGIIFQAGTSLYSGVTSDYTVQTTSDKLNTFISVCKYRASSYNTQLKLDISNQHLRVIDVPSLFLRVNELEPSFSLYGLSITPTGIVKQKDLVLKKLTLPIRLGSQKTIPLSIHL